VRSLKFAGRGERERLVSLRKVTLGLVQMRMSDSQEENLAKAVAMVGRAAQKGAEIVCLPELFDSPYFPQSTSSDIKPATLPSAVTRTLSETAMRNRIVLVGGSTFEKSGRHSYNTSFVFNANGEMLGRYRKVHLPQDPCFYEKSHFSPGEKYRVFPTSRGRIGVLICFDQWYPEAARATKLQGADVIFYPTAIGTISGVRQAEGGWQDAWEAVQRGHAVSNSVVVASVNRVGVERKLRFWGGSFVYDQFGTLLAHAGGGEEVLVARCNLDLADDIEAGWGFIRNRMPKTYSKLTEAGDA
jgi:predicted amidohydrolase